MANYTRVILQFNHVSFDFYLWIRANSFLA